MRAALTSICLLLAVTAPAQAATLRGKTTQGRDVVLRTDERGRPTEGMIKWRAACGGGESVRDRVRFRRPFDFRSRTRLRDEDDFTFVTREGYRIRAHAWVRGRRVTPRRWRGRFGLSVVVRRNGRFVGSCKTGIVGWRVSR